LLNQDRGLLAFRITDNLIKNYQLFPDVELTGRFRLNLDRLSATKLAVRTFGRERYNVSLDTRIISSTLALDNLHIPIIGGGQLVFPEYELGYRYCRDPSLSLGPYVYTTRLYLPRVCL